MFLFLFLPGKINVVPVDFSIFLPEKIPKKARLTVEISDGSVNGGWGGHW